MGNQPSNLAFGTLLVVVAAVLMRHQQWARRTALAAAAAERVTRGAAKRGKQLGAAIDEADAVREADFQTARHRRRMRAGALVGGVGLAVIGGAGVQHATTALFYWLAVLLLVVWIVLLALADALHSYSYFQSLQQRRRVEKAALEAVLRHEMEQKKKTDA